MFSALSDKLAGVLSGLTGKGVLTEDQVKDGLREIRRVLLEADVSYGLTKDFVAKVRERAVGQEVLKAVRPGQQLVKIVHDELVSLMGGSTEGLKESTVPPTVILMVGLQGSGKTTTSAKLAARLKREKRAPFLVAADVYRPAAEEQLKVLAGRIDVQVFGQAELGGEGDVVKLVQAGIDAARALKARTVIVDTAGRLQIDEELMDELVRLEAAVKPDEILLVADGMTGQDAVKIAEGFNEALSLSGVVLTKLDGDARGGAALSIRGVTQTPIKFVGVGEAMDALEVFDPARMAGRILQKGDVVGLVERAQQAVDPDASQAIAKKAMSKSGLDLEDFLGLMSQIQRMGPLKNVLGMLPGVNAKMLKGANIDDKKLKHLEAIVLSMTPEERRKPDVLNGSRRARIAKGSGRTVQEVNQLVKQFEQMKKMMKSMGKLGFR
ncbi:MAG: signal recognition particle protein [Gemmatimonadota bacterium]|nr:signal recognition particle protein [Gemmatimonadota bacterium]MDH5803594.1 signal recognition particle protein [Gemmatimonadota bacterium]